MVAFNNQDRNLKKSKRNFTDIFGIHFHPGASIKEFYNHYRNMVVMCLKRRGDIILWQNERVLDEDEELTPTFEDMILANVLGLIDCHLLELVRENYSHIFETRKCLMDYKEDILDMVSSFLTEKYGTPNLNGYIW